MGSPLPDWPRRKRQLGPVGYIYVIEFSLGVIKVGKTNNPRARIARHAYDVSRFGGTITRAWLSSPHRGYEDSEVRLLQGVAEMGTRLGGVEYFSGCHFADVVEFAASIELSAIAAAPVAWGISGARAHLVPDPESERAFAAVMKAWAKRSPRATAAEWELACRQNFSRIRQRAWPVPHRQNLVRRFRREGPSYRAIAAVFDCSWNTIRHDCADLADDGEGPTVIVSLNGSQRRPPTFRPPSAVQ